MPRCTLLTLAAILLAAPHARAERPFNGRDLDGWTTKPHGQNPSHWTVGAAQLDPRDPRKFVVEKGGDQLVNAAAHGRDAYTSEFTHGDAIVTLQVMVPKGSNSGIYLMGEYELQVLDSFGNDAKPSPGDMGAIYGAAPPKNPKYVKPGQWSSFEIHFRAPRFEGGKKVANARFEKVILNGRIIHEDVEVKGPTRSCLTGKEKPTGPLMLQGDHGAVAYRNIEVKPLR